MQLQIAIYLPEVLFEAFPLLFMGICAIGGGLLAILLPETLGSNLVETIEEVEELGIIMQIVDHLDFVLYHLFPKR